LVLNPIKIVYMYMYYGVVFTIAEQLRDH